MKIVIIDCGAGNLHSVRKAFAHQLPVGAALCVTTDAADIASASHIVLPGVGAFADCMRGLDALPGMRAALEHSVLRGTTPFLGICVGMQMLFARGHEHGSHAGLGWLAGEVEKIAPTDPNLRIPHMGWNRLRPHQPGHPLLRGMGAEESVYFVHSYAATHTKPDEIIATADYGSAIVAMIGRGHVMGTQFHPEKSQHAGLRLIHNFLEM